MSRTLPCMEGLLEVRLDANTRLCSFPSVTPTRSRILDKDKATVDMSPAKSIHLESQGRAGPQGLDSDGEANSETGQVKPKRAIGFGTTKRFVVEPRKKSI